MTSPLPDGATIGQLSAALAPLGLGTVKAIAPLSGGSVQVFRLDLSSQTAVVLKLYPGTKTSNDTAHLQPDRDVYAVSQLTGLGLPITRFLMIDESCTGLPFRFSVTNFLPGQAGGSYLGHADASSLYRQMGQLAKRLHTAQLPAYGRFDAKGIANPVASNAELVDPRISHALENFRRYGAPPALAAQVETHLAARFDAIVPFSAGPTFAHDDLHPNNILAIEDDAGSLQFSGLIDFGNAHAGDAVSDLAKCLFCSEHDAPGSSDEILAGYGPIDHPDPQGALAFYTTLHRVIMWWWLRHIGVITTPETQSDLLDALQADIGQP